MATRRDRRRVSAVSATLSAGALVFFAAGTTPASADTRSADSASGCPLGKLLCGILGAGGGTSSSPPASGGGGGGTTTKPSSAPKTKPKPKPRPAAMPPAQAHHGGSGGSSGGAGVPPPVPPAGGAPSIPLPESAQGPALPDVSEQDPLVVPEAGPGGGSPQAHLVADSSSKNEAVPPLLVATASGLIGAIAALNLSVLRRRRQD